MSIIDSLVYDRTISDVDRVKELTRKALSNGWSALTTEEKNEYLAGMKGAYNFSDMNRVGEAVEFVANKLTALPVEIASYLAAHGIANDPLFEVPYDPAEIVVTAKQDWTMESIPSQTDASNYVSDMTTLYDAFELNNAPLPPASLDYLTYIVANNIELIVKLVYEKAVAFETMVKSQIVRAENGQFYAGEIYSGEV